MKKNKLKKFASIALCLSLTMSMAACGGEKGNGGTNGNGNGAAGGTTDPAVSAENAKQGVYKSTAVSLGDDLKDFTFNHLTVYGDTLYAVGDKYTWIENKKEEGEESPADEPVADDEYYYDNGYSVTEYVLYSSKLDGSSQKHVTLNTEMDGDVDAWLGECAIDKDGNAYGVMNFGYEDEETGNWNDCYYLVGWNSDGSQKFNEELAKNSSEDSYMYCRNIGINSQNEVLVTMAGDSYSVITVASDGKIVSNKELKSSEWNEVDRVIVNGDKLYVTAYSENYEKCILHEIDGKNLSEINKAEVPNLFSNSNEIIGIGDETFLAVNDKGVYKYKMGDSNCTKLLDYVNSDMTESYFSSFAYIDDQNFLVGYWNDDKNVYEKLTYVDPKDIPDRTTLTYGCVYLDSSTKANVVKFNKTNNSYRITIKDYYEESSDWDSAITALNNDITSGKMPDILAGSSINLANLASKGLLADIKKMIQEDPELSKNEYLENVFDMYTANDVMYALPYCFGVQTFVAKTSLVGHPEKFSMKDAQEVLKKMPEGATLFGDTTRDAFIYDALSFGGDTFINFNKGECYFDSQDFIDVLEFAKTLPKEYNEDYWNDYDYTSYQTQYRDNRSLLCSLYIGAISDCKYVLKGMIGEPVSFVGFPSENGSGSILRSYGEPLAISAKSSNIDGAWQFVRQFLTEEYQNGNNNEDGSYNQDGFYGLPVLKSAFEKSAAKATQKPFWIDENGNKVEYDDTYYINEQEIIMEPFTDAEVKEICDFIYSIKGSYYYDDKVNSIIEEETSAFFAGQKQAKDCAAVLQNRVQTMLDESR